ncbi:MAG: AI-2E family transporter [Candidatus Saccharimonadales bacterium]
MKPSGNVTVNISNRTIVRGILWVAAAILFFKFVSEVSTVLTIIFTAMFLTLALNPIVSWTSRRLRIKSRVRATAVAYLTVILFLAGFLALIIPPLISQTREFIQEVPQTVRTFQASDTSLSRLIERYDLDDQLSETANNLSNRYSDFGGAALDAGRKILSVVVSILAVVALTFMMLIEGPRWLKLFWKLSPDKNRQRHQKIAHKIYRSVTGFVNGQVIMAAIGGAMTFISLTLASSILNVSLNALALAGIVAVLSLIPLFGTVLSAAIVVIFSLLNSITLGIVMLIYYIVYQQIENLTLQPYVQSKVTQLSPMTVFMAALIGVGFGGLLGAIVAIPAAGAIKVLLEDYFEQRSQSKPTPNDIP